jgi:death on curing protein
LRNEPRWLSAGDIIEINREILAGSGEPFGILKPNELESAAARPASLWAYEEEDDLVVLAVRLLAAIARNHPFEQGNKRTAFIAALNFLLNNGWRLDIADTEEHAMLIEALVEHKVEEMELVELFWRDLVRV